MGQKKLVRFAAIETYANVLQYPEGMAGKWKDFFGNENPITLELACGKGEYSVGLGRQHPNRNFIGMDVKGNRIYVGAKTALKEDLKNVAFVRTQIGKLTEYFTPGEVAEIWIVFPDPFLRDARAKNRLTHPRFLALYQQVLRPGGIIHLKTDSRELYDFTREVLPEYHCTVIEDVQDIHGKGLTASGPLSIRTHYEGLHLADGRTIYYLSFSLPAAAIVPPQKKKKTSTPDTEGVVKQIEGEDYYFLPDGRLVWTAAYLLKRGYCCGNGCRNCPYDYEAVPQPRRAVLLAAKSENDERKDPAG